MTDYSPEDRLALAYRVWGWTPHPGQRTFLCLRGSDGREPRVLVAACGRRWGKTEAVAVDAAARILTEPDLGQMAVAPTNDQAALLFDAVAERLADAQASEWVLENFPHVAELQIRQSPYPHIRRKSGGTVFSARTAGRTGRSLRGFGTTRTVKRFRVIIDERAFVPDEAVERAIKPMLATSPGGGQLVMISSPNGRRGGFYTDFERGERGDGRYCAVRLPSSQNPLVDAEFLREMQEEMSDRAFRAEFLAEFTDGAGQVFPDSEVDAAVIGDDYGRTPHWNGTYVAGADFGRRGDYTVVCVLAVETDRLRLVGFERLRGVAWSEQSGRVAAVLRAWNVRLCATDRTGVGDPVTESLQKELRIAGAACAVEPFVFTATNKEGLIDTLSLVLSQNRVRFPAHPDLVSELRRYEWSDGATGHTRFSAPSGGHDDAVCALALAVHAARDFVHQATNITPRVYRANQDSDRNTGGYDPPTTNKEIRFSCGNSGITKQPVAQRFPQSPPSPPPLRDRAQVGVGCPPTSRRSPPITRLTRPVVRGHWTRCAATRRCGRV